MAKIQSYDYTNFERGIVKISVAKDLQKLNLPEPARLVSSEKEDAQLTKLWKPASLETVLKASLMPAIRDRDELSPSIYQKRLRDAKQEFIKILQEEQKKRKKGTKTPFEDDEEEQKKRKRRSKNPFEDDPEEIFEQVINDLEELENHQDLLWMLRQVVHLA